MNLTQKHISVIEALCVGVIPTSDTVGAKELPVAEMIALVYEYWPEFKKSSFRESLDAVDQFCFQLFNIHCASVSQAQALMLVNEISWKEEFSSFWVPFRVMCVLNYYGHPEGAASINMPGPSIDTGGYTSQGERNGI
ncbi:gluconate 2-dehydrogenase subunit 3 family protein [Pseudoalteromonas piscicida]|uniref:Gluconate 2-dehydrogenase subunit 3 family protein n=1 Tax=Pseudoalteromonas piscicida TaxID=43662 RepID=A0AAD0REU8_PSEO7|nr:gluconate 2-dehydrogenase subunit 3 family protein [Pseudoalteromonas piscicida]ASD68186.1 hypothetical protein B1L02_14965 [Pseudoalteromonas piscicida]AXR01107.1 gluconate 2-dehydrogenase subunit 3 family protein [Pseudoalteromonas piscicida]